MSVVIYSGSIHIYTCTYIYLYISVSDHCFTVRSVYHQGPGLGYVYRPWVSDEGIEWVA